jgi:phosphate acetyltransferase
MGPASGKSIVALGLVELLSHRITRIRFVRPIVQHVPNNDPELIRARYQLADDHVRAAGPRRPRARPLPRRHPRDDPLAAGSGSPSR